MDKIFIKKLLVRGIIGINADEREKPQDILIIAGIIHRSSAKQARATISPTASITAPS